MRCAPVANAAFALLRKYFVPGSNRAFGKLLDLLGRLIFVPHGQVELFCPVADLQAALSTCQHQGVTVDWGRAYRLLVSALSEAGNLRLELPSDGRTLSW